MKAGSSPYSYSLATHCIVIVNYQKSSMIITFTTPSLPSSPTSSDLILD